MTKDPTPPPAANPGLTAAMGLTGQAGLTSGTDVSSLLQTILYGATGRQGVTSAPLTGFLPRWAQDNQQVAGLVAQGSVDPYLPIPNDPSTWQVYKGSGPAADPNAAKHNQLAHDYGDTPANAGTTGDTTTTVGQMMNEPYLWSEDEVASAIKKFQKAGLTSVVDFDSMQKAWSGLVQRAGAMYSMSSGKNKVTPWDVLDIYKNEMSKAGTTDPNAPFTGSRTTTQRNVSEISQGDAWAALKQTTTQLLGHDPSDQEVRDFAYRMNSLAAASPSISTTTTQYDKGQATNSNTTSKAGFNASDIQKSAYDQAQSDPDYAEFQSGSTYFNAALSALGQIGA
jgi:hypothetical protein